jgi:hypothetical protein
MNQTIEIRGSHYAISDEDGVTFAAVHDHASVQWLTSDELREMADAMDERRRAIEAEADMDMLGAEA